MHVGKTYLSTPKRRSTLLLTTVHWPPILLINITELDYFWLALKIDNNSCTYALFLFQFHADKQVAYIQQFLIKSVVHPWQEAESLDGVKAPLAKIFTLLEEIANFHLEEEWVHVVLSTAAVCNLRTAEKIYVPGEEVPILNGPRPANWLSDLAWSAMFALTQSEHGGRPKQH